MRVVLIPVTVAHEDPVARIVMAVGKIILILPVLDMESVRVSWNV